jgi:hypothetical protein
MWVLVANSFRLITAFTKRSKSFVEKVQVGVASFLILLLGLYMIMLLVTVYATVRDTIGEDIPGKVSQTFASENASGDNRSANQQQREAALPPPDAKESWWLHFLQVTIIVFTSLGLISRKNAKLFLARFSAWYIGTITYLNQGSSRNNIKGQLVSLLEHVVEKRKDGNTYRKVHIMGYSFGSIVAIDAMFPDDYLYNRPRAVNTLVTIGCPFDFIRTYWPTYFEQRVGFQGVPQQWLNIYAPTDVLGSNFLDEDKGDKRQGVELSVQRTSTTPDPYLGKPKHNKTFGKDEMSQQRQSDNRIGQRIARLIKQAYIAVTLVGFKVHSRYWFDDPYAPDCFDIVVREIYADDTRLSS